MTHALSPALPSASHLLVLILPVLLSHQLNECVVDASTMWQEETAAWAQVMEEEELLLHTNITMIALFGLLHT